MSTEPLTPHQEPTPAEVETSALGEAVSGGTPETNNDSPVEGSEGLSVSSASPTLASEADQPLDEPAATDVTPQLTGSHPTTAAVGETTADPSAGKAEGHCEPESPAEATQEETAKPQANVSEPQASPIASTPDPAPGSKKQWYVVKVQSGREDTIREAIERKVRKEGLEAYFGQIKIPVEKVSEVKLDKNGKKVTRTRERRLYAGYIFAEVEYNDRILYLFRETSGVGGFVGEHPGQPERPPTPMSEREIQRILGGAVSGTEDAKVSNVPPPPKGLNVGDHVRVVDGPFNGMDAVVKAIQTDQAKIIAEVMIFGRPVNVDFEYFQIEQ
ncbi:MAG: transcription termination/antitermination NusG family protein [Gemmataceae bacterium]